MRKQIIPSTPNKAMAPHKEWLPLEQVARVEITSEDPAHPVESALLPSSGDGWRAATPGTQLLRLCFDIPQRLQHIRLHFVETQIERTQEFVLRYMRDNDPSPYEILRQQWNFNPHGSASELEEYEVDLSEVTTLELTIIPDISGGNVYASLAELRLA